MLHRPIWNVHESCGYTKVLGFYVWSLRFSTSSMPYVQENRAIPQATVHCKVLSKLCLLHSTNKCASLAADLSRPATHNRIFCFLNLLWFPVQKSLKHIVNIIFAERAWSALRTQPACANLDNTKTASLCRPARVEGPWLIHWSLEGFLFLTPRTPSCLEIWLVLLGLGRLGTSYRTLW